jgi:hypothetical protein
MRPAPSLAYVSTLLDPRRRRHHRVRRLWYAGLGLLGLGLLLGGWWVTRRLVPRSAHAATAVALVLRPTRPWGTTGPWGALGEPLWACPALLAPVASQARGCQTRPALPTTAVVEHWR